jgi:hypothetical protein
VFVAVGPGGPRVFVTGASDGTVGTVGTDHRSDYATIAYTS